MCPVGSVASSEGQLHAGTEAWRLGQLAGVKRSSAKASCLMGQSSSQKSLWVQLVGFSSEFHYWSETTGLHNILKEWNKARWVLFCFFLAKWSKCTPASWKFTLILLNSSISNTQTKEGVNLLTRWNGLRFLTFQGRRNIWNMSLKFL